MVIWLKGTFNAFKLFVKQSGTNTAFTFLFYSLVLVINYYFSQDLKLHSFPGRMIGMATLEGNDVNSRISLFYACLAVLFLSYTGFNLFAYFLFQKKPALLFSIETKMINYSSLAGIFILLFRVFDIKIYETTEIIYFIHKFILAGIILKFFFPKNKLSTSYYALILCLSASLYFLVSDLLIVSGAQKPPDFYLLSFSVACILLLGLHFFLKTTRQTAPTETLRRVSYTLLPLVFLPFVSVLKDEIILILRANSIVVENRLPVYMMLLSVLVFFIILRSRRKQKVSALTEKSLISHSYFPWFIFSVVTYLFYSPSIDYYEELFEMGNVYLPIMEFMRFGVIPPIEKLSTHLLSDFFWGGIYTCFNGLKNGEVSIYDFMILSVSSLLYYFVVYFISRNPYIALFSVLLYPFSEAMMGSGFCMSVLGIFALNKLLIDKQSLKNYILLFLTFSFLLLWRIDLAYTCFMAIPLVILYYMVTDSRFKINFRLLLKGLAYVSSGLLLVLAFVSLYRHVNLFERALYVLNYCMSAQSYGQTTLDYLSETKHKMHLFVFPAVVCILLIALTIRFKSLNSTKGQRLAFLTLIFISFFYLINFNRGLARHTLGEGTDGANSSFVYLILACTPFVLLKKQSPVFKFSIFFVISFFTVLNFKIPDPKDSKGLFELLQAKLKTTPLENPLTLARIKNIPPDSGEMCRPFVNFVKKHIPDNQTFIDFGCKPVLYFFTEKETPSWVYQNPLCLHNDYLQKKFIDDLADYNTPYLLFGSNPETFDEVDGVPDFLRHYRLAEYFYNHYSPYVLLGKFCMWKSNTVKDINKKDTLYTYTNADSLSKEASVTSPLITTKATKNYLIKIVSRINHIPYLKILSGKDSLTLSSKKISDTVVYIPVPSDLNNFRLSLNNSNGGVLSLRLVEYDYMPDFYSEQTLTCNFRKLPYVWGQFDKTLPREQVLYSKKIIENKGNNPNEVFDIPASLDKTSGNTVIVTCRNTNKTPKKLYLEFGNSGEKNHSRIYFDVQPSPQTLRYAVRVSCLYKWSAGRVNRLRVSSDEPANDVELTQLEVTKGI